MNTIATPLPSSALGDPVSVPQESYPRLFWRFLRFGLLAWGGPVAQIGMIRHELVEEEKWISREKFNRVLAVYQVLPGPEAQEMCVYFGMLAGGRWGGFLAGFAFLLPGLLLMLALSWFYIHVGISSPLFAGIFYGMQAVVPALIIRAIHRIGEHTLTNRWLWTIAIAVAFSQLIGVHFLYSLTLAGLVALFAHRRSQVLLFLTGLIFFTLVVITVIKMDEGRHLMAASPIGLTEAAPSLMKLFASGLRSGLLTFGGAYTVISFLQHDAVEVGRWMTNAQFLDGLALSGIIPAPLIIFATFVGYLGGGFWGAIVLTVGIFLPAFGFTLIGHRYVEKAISHPSLHSFLEGITAGVVGLVAATALILLRSALPDLFAFGLFATGLFLLYYWKNKAVIPVVVLGAGLSGILVRL